LCQRNLPPPLAEWGFWTETSVFAAWLSSGQVCAEWHLRVAVTIGFISQD
jgi:hypothetical protein